MALLAFLFIVVPIAEIYLIIEIGGQIGTLNTLAVMVVTAVAGAWLAKHQGLAAVRNMQQSMLQGQAIGRSLVEAALVLVAAVTMLTPGFLTDFTGLALLIPPVRKVVAELITRRVGKRMQQGVRVPQGSRMVIDVEGFEVGDTDGGASGAPDNGRDSGQGEAERRVIDV